MTEALSGTVSALAGPERTLSGRDLEAAMLTGGNGRRAFVRLVEDELDALLG